MPSCSILILLPPVSPPGGSPWASLESSWGIVLLALQIFLWAPCRLPLGSGKTPPIWPLLTFWYICCWSVAKSCLTLCNGLQHTLRPCLPLSPGVCSDSCPLSQRCHPTISFCCPFSFAFSISQHQGLFQWFGSSHQMAQVLELLHQPLMSIQGWLTLGLTNLTPLRSRGLLRVFCSTTVQKHQFFSAQLCLWSNSHIHTWLLEKP